LLDFYREKALKGLLFFSSSEIYGDPAPEFVPTKEDYRGNVSATGPRACYDESKRFGETLCFVYSSQFGLPISVVRPFNNFGPGMSLNDRRVPADFAKAVLSGEDIVIYSDGSPTRTFCYVADAVAGYLKALCYGKLEPFNIGIEKPEISVSRLAEYYVASAKTLLGYTGKVRYESSGEKDYLTHNPLRRCPSIDKARRLLGFKPSIEVGEGVSRFIEFLKEEKSR
jgi:UDP-glucuronate decarboxylase